MKLSAKITLGLDVLIYLFFILSGFKANILFYIYTGLNIVSFFYHYFMITKKKMSISIFVAFQFILMVAIFGSWYVMFLMEVNLQEHYLTLYHTPLVFVMILVDYFIHRVKTNIVSFDEEESIETSENEIVEIEE